MLAVNALERTGGKGKGVANVPAPFIMVQRGLRQRFTLTQQQAWHERHMQSFGQGAGNFIGLIESALDEALPAQRHNRQQIGAGFRAKGLQERIGKDGGKRKSAREFERKDELINGRCVIQGDNRGVVSRRARQAASAQGRRVRCRMRKLIRALGTARGGGHQITVTTGCANRLG